MAPDTDRPDHVGRVAQRLHFSLLRVFAALPRRLRRAIVRVLSPSFTVGAMCLIERSDGAILLVRQSYRNAWGIPGGLLRRGEDAADGVRREVLEEVGIDVDVVGGPTAVVDAEPQRVDVVFRARVSDEVAATAQPRSPEIVELDWFPRDELPGLQPETVTAIMALSRVASPSDGVVDTRVRRWPSRSAL